MSTTTASNVTRSESTTDRFGRVITYTVRLDGVTFHAERMVGASDDYTVWLTIGHCGSSFTHPTDEDGKHLKVPGGPRVAARFAALAESLRAGDPARYVSRSVRHPHERTPGRRSHSELCTDRAACGRFDTSIHAEHFDATIEDWWVCPCGNDPGGSGLASASPAGEWVAPTRVEWQQPHHYGCVDCGRFGPQDYRDPVAGTVPVVGRMTAEALAVTPWPFVSQPA